MEDERTPDQDDLVVLPRNSGFTFPAKLHQMLQHSSSLGIVSWNENGDAFVVIDRGDRLSLLLNRFDMSPVFRSFQRQLNMYGFVTTSGSTFHPSFRRDQPGQLNLVIRIQRNNNLLPARAARNNEAAASSDDETPAVSNSDEPHIPFANEIAQPPSTIDDSSTCSQQAEGGGDRIDVEEGNTEEPMMAENRRLLQDLDRRLLQDLVGIAQYLPFDINSIPSGDAPLTRAEIDAWNNRLQYLQDK